MRLAIKVWQFEQETQVSGTPTLFTTNWEPTMLVLSRKLGEKIVIGDNILVTVVKIDRNQIRIGIEAPQDVSVYREEIAPARAARSSREAVLAG